MGQKKRVRLAVSTLALRMRDMLRDEPRKIFGRGFGGEIGITDEALGDVLGIKPGQRGQRARY